jgi:acetyl-CoA carboxylase carboxyltransferase component
MKTLNSVALAAFATALIAAVPASATTLASYTSGTSSATFVPGQSFTVAGAGTFNDIRFNFYNASLQAIATGSLYLFTSEYTGTTQALASTTANRIGVAAASGSTYAFDLSTILTAGTVYYAYADRSFTLSGTASGTYAGGNAYTANSGSFAALTAQDINFTVTGTPPAVPEPASWAMMILGMGAVGGALRRRSKVSTTVKFA